MRRNNSETIWLRTELFLFFGVAPVLVGRFIPSLAWIPVLWIAALGAYLHLRLRPARIPEASVTANNTVSGRKLAARFIISAVVVLAGVAMGMPARFLSFPHQRPYLWLAVMVLYPVLSVWPQEFLYRLLFPSFPGPLPERNFTHDCECPRVQLGPHHFSQPLRPRVNAGGGIFLRRYLPPQPLAASGLR